MSPASTPAPAASIPLPEPANERFKRRARAGTWVGMLLATGAHLLLFLLWPTMTVEVSAETRAVPEVVRLEETVLPDRPEAPRRPAAPVPVADLGLDVTMAPTTFDAARPLLPPPPDEEGEGYSGGLLITPMTTPPRILNPGEVSRRLEAMYPPTLRDAGVGGEVLLHVHIDASGALLEARVAGSSGFDSLDRAALAVVESCRFSPALNRDDRVAVWVALPIVFRTR